ncbi:glycosyltransferase family 4 protein [Candidatus Colwellia aromaticivorans]|uniref:glycosyltransferase family 4 protein n=1 Tax=Candidatus Colwellia aromaticivorans TaxID=2267621 RepID=UPI000DF45098|nr:glycosyltransferase family 4 protein [Candidatus Colwellia aromaticivorans]
MRIALISYPMLFQKKGGLQIQVQETLTALCALGVDAKIFDTLNDKLEDFDILHVFGLANGNESIIKVAKELGLKVVLSPLARCSWTKARAQIAKISDRIVGKLTHWHVKSDYAMCNDAYTLSDYVIFLGEQEYLSATSAFNVDQTAFTIVANGINQRYFQTNGDAYREKYASNLSVPLILVVGSINQNKNQLALVEAMKDFPCQIHIIGPCVSSEQKNLDHMVSYQHVKYIGYLDNNDPMLASAYAAADLFCLPSYQEVLPLTVFEALAAGTPVAATNNSAIEFAEDARAYAEFSPQSQQDIRSVVINSLQQSMSKEACKMLVADKSWQAVAEQLMAVYNTVNNDNSTE